MNKMSNLSSRWNEHYADILTPNTIIAFLELISGIVGNGLVLFLYAFKMDNIYEDRYFIPVLAILDLSACIASTTFCIVNSFYWVIYPSGILCKLLYFMCSFSAGASAHALLVISLHRYLKICRPNGIQMTGFWKRLSVISIVIVSIVYSLPILDFSGLHNMQWIYKGENVTGSMCKIAANTTEMSAMMHFGTVSLLLMINILATIFMYSRIGLVVHRRFIAKKRESARRKNTKAFYSEGTSQQISKVSESMEGTKSRGSTEPSIVVSNSIRAKKGRTNFNYMFFSIIAAYVLCYIPTGTMIFIGATVDNFWFNLSDTRLGLYAFINRIYILNFIVNPVIYGYFDTSFRSEVKKLFRK